jgi:hypothetical protein
MAEENKNSASNLPPLPDTFETIYDDFEAGVSVVEAIELSEMSTSELKDYSKDSPAFMQAYVERLLEETPKQTDELPEQ